MSSPRHRGWRVLLAILTASLAGAALASPAAQAASKPAPADTAGWHVGTPPLTTPWTGQVSPTNALPDYPRPQQTRTDWQNLNGVWQFAPQAAGQTTPIGRDLDERILVPYPVESALSGIQRHETAMWYRRTFTVPTGWKVSTTKNRLLLHFGAVDYQSTVWVNGVKVGGHKGGYDAWTLDVTSAITKSGPQEIVVAVTDPTDAGTQPVGKQRNNPSGIFYTPTSGIWQTVWIEPVAASYIDHVDSTPKLANNTLTVKVAVTGAAPGQNVQVTASAGGKTVGSITGAPGTNLALPVPNAHRWSPDDPYLYDLKVSLLDAKGKKAVDTVGSYFGMRSIGLGTGSDGKVRMLLNGKFTFNMGVLDQGFWPDGIYTAPTDDALKFDLQQEKALGYNTVRKHIKIEPARWYYWADKLGLMVWQDMPAMRTDWPDTGGQPPTPARAEYEAEMHRIVNQLKSTTSITTWVPFNEGWGDYEVARVSDQLAGWDPSRLVDPESGVNCCASEPDSGAGDIYDDHTYVGPGTPAPDPHGRAVVDGEFGGLGLRVAGHEWSPGNGFAYEMEPDADTLTNRYVQLIERTKQVELQCGLSAAIYTQPTDVENEVNGLYTYDRQVLKPDAARVAAVNKAVIAASSQVGTGTPPTFPPGTPGLTGVASYPSDEGSGTVLHDASGRGHDATLVNGPSFVPGHSGTAVQYNGSNQYADTGAALLDTTGNYSVSAWVKLDSLGGFATAVSQDGDSNSAFFLQYSGADNRFAFSFAGVRALAPTAPETGRWYHLVGVRDAAAGTLTLYVDGARAGSASACLGDPSTGHTVIGRGKFGGNPVDYWRGALDQVHVYDRALTAAEVASLYGSNA